MFLPMAERSIDEEAVREASGAASSCRLGHVGRGERLQALSTPESATGCLIKGNISSKGESIYHVPGDQHYDRTKIRTSKGERWFCSEAEAVAAGWRKAER